jgi:hypothetical protein
MTELETNLFAFFEQYARTLHEDVEMSRVDGA